MTKNLKLLCVNNIHVEDYLTLHKIYTCIKIDRGSYVLDCGETFYSYRFIIVEAKNDKLIGILYG